jgi:hypothetical protein
MSHDRQPCPLDNSRLVSMGLSYGAKGLDLSIWYCPLCDVAFVLLSPARSSTPPDALQWHRRNGQLELREEDRRRWEELPRQFREAWESNVRFHVMLFLRGRFTEAVSCPLDGGSIPIVHRDVEGASVPWLFAWCTYCRMGFLYVRDVFYGWEHSADIVWDVKLKKFEFCGQYETGGKNAVGSQVLRELPLLPGLMQ